MSTFFLTTEKGSQEAQEGEGLAQAFSLRGRADEIHGISSLPLSLL